MIRIDISDKEAIENTVYMPLEDPRSGNAGLCSVQTYPQLFSARHCSVK